MVLELATKGLKELSLQFIFDSDSAVEKEVAQTPTVATVSPLENMGIRLVYVTSLEKAIESTQVLLQCRSNLGLDIETYRLSEFSADKQGGLEPRKSDIRTVQLYDGKDTVFVFDILKLGGLMYLDQNLWNRQMLAHNAIFELKHLLHKGVFPKRLGCTLLVDRVLHGSRRDLKVEIGLCKTATLKDLAKELLGLDISKEEQTSNWSQLNIDSRTT